MPVNPHFLAARAREQSNRIIAHLPRPEALLLPLHPAPAAGFIRRMCSAFRRPVAALSWPIVHFTNRHRLELGYAGNAFLDSTAPLLGDVQAWLWRLHPLFLRPSGELPNRRQPGGPMVFASARECRAALRIRRQLIALAPRMDLFAAEHVIRSYAATVSQDAQRDITREHVGRAAPEPNYYDDLLAYAEDRWRMSRDEALDTPTARLFQRLRNELLNSPNGILKVSAPSDALLAPPVPA